MENKTYIPKETAIERRWYVVDATDQTLGRLATRVAAVVRGKEKPYFTPHLDTGDFVIVINAEKIRVTGKKLDDKMYYKHSGYIGHLKSANLRTLLARKPEKVIQLAVKGMLPKTTLGRKLLTKVKIYRGAAHPHASQKPLPLAL